MERELVESEETLAIRVPLLRRIGFAAGATAVFIWVILFAAAFEARTVAGVTTFEHFAQRFAGNWAMWTTLIFGCALFSVVIAFWATAAVYLDLNERTVRSVTLLLGGRQSLDPASTLVLQRHPFSFRRYLLMLEVRPGIPFVLFAGSRTAAESIAGQVAKIAGLAMEERLAEAGRPVESIWVSRGTVAAGTLMLAVAAFIAYDTIFVRTGLIESEKMISLAMICLATLGGLFTIHGGRVSALPKGRRNERWLSAFTLYFIGYLLATIAVAGVVDGVRDAFVIFDDPGFATIVAAADLFFPVAIAAVAWSFIRLGYERHRNVGLLGYRASNLPTD
jgi:hypothetical protein